MQVTLSEREKKLLALIQKQDRLLYIAFYMLLNLSEDIEVERKMKKKVSGGRVRVGREGGGKGLGGGEVSAGTQRLSSVSGRWLACRERTR